MEFLNALTDVLTYAFVSMHSRLAALYLAVTVVIAAVIWIARGRPQTFMSWLLPAAVYRHKSNLLDIKIFLFNAVLVVSGFFAAVAFTPMVTVWFLEVFVGLSGAPFNAIEFSWTRSLIATVIMILTLDFCKYWAHYIHHEHPALWPFHAVHHSAEVMTPLTVARVHPMYRIMQALIVAVIVGLAQAVILFAIMGEIDVLTIGSANAGYVIFNMLGSNLRHSHIWLSYGHVAEHFFISPAQHHIHHSSDKKHFNKNYGEVFAFWDWMFGTLYITAGQEDLTFGIADADGNRIEQPHPTLRAALFHPFVESWEALRGPKADPQEANQQ